jgi:hypothetical protein
VEVPKLQLVLHRIGVHHQREATTIPCRQGKSWEVGHAITMSWPRGPCRRRWESMQLPNNMTIRIMGIMALLLITGMLQT